MDSKFAVGSSGWLIELDRTMVSLSRGKMLQGNSDANEQCPQKLLDQLLQSMEAASESKEVERGSLSKRLQRFTMLHQAYRRMWDGVSTDDVKQFVAKTWNGTKDVTTVLDKANLQECLDDSSRMEALATYRKVASSLKPEATHGFEARLSIVRVLERQGKPSKRTNRGP